jgi:hypothetical protein
MVTLRASRPVAVPVAFIVLAGAMMLQPPLQILSSSPSRTIGVAGRAAARVSAIGGGCPLQAGDSRRIAPRKRLCTSV